MTNKRPEPVDLSQFEGMTPGPWESYESAICMPSEGHPEHGIMDTFIMARDECREVVDIKRIYNGDRDLDMEHANARAVLAVPSMIADLKATRAERDNKHKHIRAEVVKWRDEATHKSVAAHVENPNGTVEGLYAARSIAYDRVLYLLDGE